MHPIVLKAKVFFLSPQVNFTVAIDFTASNGKPSDPRSLHYMVRPLHQNSQWGQIRSGPSTSSVAFWDAGAAPGGRLGTVPVSTTEEVNRFAKF